MSLVSQGQTGATMLNISFSLPKNRVRISYAQRRYGAASIGRLTISVVKRKPSPKSIFGVLESLQNVRAGSRTSRLIRILLGRINLKSIVGRNLAIIALASGLLVPGASAMSQQEPQTNVLPLQDAKITTQVKIRYPTEKVRINQGYSYFHWGLDLGGNLGDSVYPVMAGTVEQVEQSKFAYGNSILVDHGSGLKSLYAHLHTINIQVGDNVYTKEPIGQVGSTGYSTGPHLHLEVYKNSRAVDPRSVLETQN